MYLRNHSMFTWAVQYPQSLVWYFAPFDVSFLPDHFTISSWLGDLSWNNHLSHSRQSLLWKRIQAWASIPLPIYRFYVRDLCPVISKGPIGQGLGHCSNSLLAILLLLATCSSHLNTEFLCQKNTSVKGIKSCAPFFPFPPKFL